LKQLKGGEMPSASQVVVGSSSGLPVLGNAPELTGITGWLNSDPLTLASLKGKVVLIDFWTYSCINCIRTLPHVTSWYDTYKDQGLVVIGVHSPEFAFEKDSGNVANAIKEHAIHYPVAQDNNFATWNAYSNQYWPAEYLIDAQGRVRETHFGEGNYDETEANIRSLLKEAANTSSLPRATSVADSTPTTQLTPETYVGIERRQRYSVATDATQLNSNNWTNQGKWIADAQYITSAAAGDTVSLRFYAKDVYLVLNPTNGATPADILLDGVAIGSQGGADVQKSTVQVTEDRLYHLVHLNSAGDHVLTLKASAAGLRAFAFTFG
jgi:thiol-disulfide isomerase/thioredoxin